MAMAFLTLVGFGAFLDPTKNESRFLETEPDALVRS
jgi:hypothetical protein